MKMTFTLKWFLISLSMKVTVLAGTRGRVVRYAASLGYKGSVDCLQQTTRSTALICGADCLAQSCPAFSYEKTTQACILHCSVRNLMVTKLSGWALYEQSYPDCSSQNARVAGPFPSNLAYEYSFDDQRLSQHAISRVRIKKGSYIDSITLWYGRMSSEVHGGSGGGQEYNLYLEPEENIVQVTIGNRDPERLIYIKIVTDKQHILEEGYTHQSGSVHVAEANRGQALRYVSGKHGTGTDSYHLIRELSFYFC